MIIFPGQILESYPSNCSLSLLISRTCPSSNKLCQRLLNQNRISKSCCFWLLSNVPFLKQIIPKDFRSIANMYDSRKCTHTSSNCAKKHQKQYKYNSTQIIAGPFFVHVLHHCQHQTPQSYRGDKVMYCTLIVICGKLDWNFVVVERCILLVENEV